MQLSELGFLQCESIPSSSPYYGRCLELSARRPNVNVAVCAGISRVDKWLDCIERAPDLTLPPAPPTITVSPTIQTQVSPQISPVFQQAFQPSGSPMTAGATQTMPTTQAGTAPPPAGPDYGALLQSQQAMYEKLLTQAMQPIAQQPAPYYPPAPAVTAPIPAQPLQPLISMPDLTQTAATLPSVVIPTDGYQAPVLTPPQIPLQKTNFMPIIIIALGAVGLLVITRKKGRKHAT